MKIKTLKKKCITYSVILIIVGILISAIGFGTAGFSYQQLEKNKIGDNWYQTVHINEEKIWYGVNLGGNIHLLSIGDAD